MAIVVLSEPFNKRSNNRNRKCVRARCTLCGKEFEPRLSEIEKIKSCGCGGRFKIKHGKTGSTEYKSWDGMRQRCSNPNNSKYPLYGGRGIKVCERWQESFENFLADMGNKPDGTTLDRIDPDGDYEPNNCRWASVTEQNNNKRTNLVIEVDGQSKTVAEWVRKTGQNYTTVTERLSRGWSPKEAVLGKSNA